MEICILKKYVKSEKIKSQNQKNMYLNFLMKAQYVIDVYVNNNHASFYPYNTIIGPTTIF